MSLQSTVPSFREVFRNSSGSSTIFLGEFKTPNEMSHVTICSSGFMTGSSGASAVLCSSLLEPTSVIASSCLCCCLHSSREKLFFLGTETHRILRTKSTGNSKKLCFSKIKVSSTVKERQQSRPSNTHLQDCWKPKYLMWMVIPSKRSYLVASSLWQTASCNLWIWS